MRFTRHGNAAVSVNEPDDTDPDYGDDATTRVLVRRDVRLTRPRKSSRDNSHLLPSVIVDEPPEATLQLRTMRMKRIPPAPISHTRAVAPAAKVPSLAMIALVISIGVIAIRALPQAGRWIELLLASVGLR